ncbi:MAG TPA: YfhO family protein [Puia sp.]|jgi:hypothetical protein
MKQIDYKTLLRKLLPHIVAGVVFLVVAVLYCKPVFEDKVLYQEDVLQWQGMARNSFQYKETHGHFPLWSNSMFGGMPAYQIAMDSQSVSVPSLFYGLLTLWMQKPVNFFFLACCCFYFLALVLRIDPWIGIIGALAYAYSTYNPVIVSVGHDTKMQSIALLPAVIGSLVLLCERRYWLGMALTALFSALMISFNHIQIVYYTMIIAAGVLAGYGIRWIRQGDARQLARTVAMALGAVLVGILSNAVVLFTTYDSSRETVRGGSELADTQGNINHNGLSEQSAFDFSMYKLEPFVMLVPDIYGGSTDLELPRDQSRAVRAQEKMSPALAGVIGEDGPRFYWGGIGEFNAGPPYVGAVICLLALLGFFILDNKHKWWILGVSVLTIVMSWGSYFIGFNGFLLKWLPMYNKFRAPSMIMVVPTFLFCLLAVLTLQQVLVSGNREMIWRRYKWGLLLVLGIFGVLGGLYMRFDYTSAGDGLLLKKAAVLGQEALQQMRAFVDGLRLDRQELFGRSIVRSLLFIAGAAVVLGLYIRRTVHPALLLGVVGVLAFVDVMGIDLRYLNKDNYKEREDYQQNFITTDADRQILKDKSYYRVFDLRDSASNALSYGAMTAYFHRSIGGYHAAKLKIYEDLINHQLSNYPNCGPVIDMLNTKYVIRPVSPGRDSVYRNDAALGPVWFVRKVRYEATPQAVMNGLTRFHPKDTAILFAADSGRVSYDPHGDPSGSIRLLKNDNDEITYLSQALSRRFAVFSEIYYDRGWHAWVDDHEVPILRTNYVLRGITVPPGRHIIRMAFRPFSYYLGRQMQWMASLIFLLMLAGAVIVYLQEKDQWPPRGFLSGLKGLGIPFKHVSSPEKCEPLSNA